MAAQGLTTLLKFGTDISQLATGLNQSKELISSFANTIKSAMDTVVQTVQRAIQSLIQLGKQIMTLGSQAARLDSMRDSFNKMAAEFGATGQELLKAMNEATLGMARNSELIGNSMTAMMLISKEAMGDVSKTLPMFAKIATAASRALGTSVEYMFGSIARGVGRASTLILDNLGMIIKLADVYGDFAKELGKTRKELTTVEKQTALVNEVLRQGDAYVRNLGISTGGLATKQKQLTKLLVDFKDTMGQAVMPMVQAFQSLWTDVANTVVSRLIPAFRTLGRVLSEVFGTKNPFERWIEGDPIGKTIERVKRLKAGLEDLIADGADFAGEVTDANERFEEAVLKLESDRFGPRLAKIQSDLTERVQTIWEDYHFRRARKAEDNNREDVRREEKHKEDLIAIENRYTDQISDAIRNRDARALLNLLRRQSEEKKSTKKQFADEQTDREEDRKLEEKRAEEDAQRREDSARKAAAKQYAAVNAEFDKAVEELEKTRQKEINAAQKAYEARYKNFEDLIQKQNNLMAQQIREESALRREMSKPLPPVWEKIKEVLEGVWEKLQDIRDAIVDFVEAPQFNILEKLGISPETLENIKVKLQEAAEWFAPIIQGAKELWAAFLEIAGPEFVLMWEDLKLAFEELKPYWPEISAAFKFLAGAAIKGLVVGLALVLAALRGLISIAPTVARFFGRLAITINRTWKGISNTIRGSVKIIVGIITLNLTLIRKGIEQWKTGVGQIIANFFLLIRSSVVTFIGGILVLFQGFAESLIDIFVRIKDRLIGHSIIPEMLDGIKSLVDSFFTDVTQRWRDGWNGLVTIVSTVWQTISGIVTEFTSGIGETIDSWFSGIGETIEKASAPTRQVTGYTGYQTGTSSFSADNWNIYANERQDSVADQAYRAVTDVFSSPSIMDRWRRK